MNNAWMVDAISSRCGKALSERIVRRNGSGYCDADGLGRGLRSVAGLLEDSTRSVRLSMASTPDGTVPPLRLSQIPRYPAAVAASASTSSWSPAETAARARTPRRTKANSKALGSGLATPRWPEVCTTPM